MYKSNNGSLSLQKVDFWNLAELQNVEEKAKLCSKTGANLELVGEDGGLERCPRVVHCSRKLNTSADLTVNFELAEYVKNAVGLPHL